MYGHSAFVNIIIIIAGIRKTYLSSNDQLSRHVNVFDILHFSLR